MRMGHVVPVEKRSHAHRVLVGKPEEKRPLGRLRRGWGDNIKINLQERGWGGWAWTKFVWLKIRTGGRHLVNAVVNLWVA